MAEDREQELGDNTGDVQVLDVPPLVALRQGLRLATFAFKPDAARPFDEAIRRAAGLRGSSWTTSAIARKRVAASSTSSEVGRRTVPLKTGATTSFEDAGGRNYRENRKNR